MADTLSIDLTVEDVKEMDPDMVVDLYSKVKQSRDDMRRERDQVREDGQRVRSENAMLQVRLQQALGREQRKDQVLSQVAMKMVQLGVLDALSLNLREDEE